MSPLSSLDREGDASSSVSSAAIVGRAGHTIASTLTTTVIAKLALFELTGISAIPLLLLFLEIPALRHSMKSMKRRWILLFDLQETSIFHPQQPIGHVKNAWIMGDHQNSAGLLTGQFIQQLHHGTPGHTVQ